MIYSTYNVHVQGAFRSAITAFIQVSPDLKETIWTYLEQYDLPVVVGPSPGHSGQHVPSQVCLTIILLIFILAMIFFVWKMYLCYLDQAELCSFVVCVPA